MIRHDACWLTTEVSGATAIARLQAQSLGRDPKLLIHAYRLLGDTPNRSATSLVPTPRYVTCRAASILNSLVNRFLLMRPPLLP